ncbi:hypothetical protein GE09DRAFT_648513 [Coniochaeta sp. 2T2.1]|nr:hypothetical protein GE09DRAFT_648513 [Coniochaeta sp. 2T2.1]
MPCASATFTADRAWSVARDPPHGHQPWYGRHPAFIRHRYPGVSWVSLDCLNMVVGQSGDQHGGRQVRFPANLPKGSPYALQMAATSFETSYHRWLIASCNAFSLQGTITTSVPPQLAVSVRASGGGTAEYIGYGICLDLCCACMRSLPQQPRWRPRSKLPQPSATGPRRPNMHNRVNLRRSNLVGLYMSSRLYTTTGENGIRVVFILSVTMSIGE